MFAGTEQGFVCKCPRCLAEERLGKDYLPWAEERFGIAERTVQQVGMHRRAPQLDQQKVAHSALELLIRVKEDLAVAVGPQQLVLTSWAPLFSALVDLAALLGDYASAASYAADASQHVAVAVPSSAFHVELLAKQLLFSAVAAGDDKASAQRLQQAKEDLHAAIHTCYGPSLSRQLEPFWDFLDDAASG